MINYGVVYLIIYLLRKITKINLLSKFLIINKGSLNKKKKYIEFYLIQ